MQLALGFRLAGWLPPFLLVGVAVALYLNSLSVPFLFDDFPGIVNNREIERVQDAWHYLRPRGLVSLTLALNYRWEERNVRGYHLVNVAVHACNALLVYVLVLWVLQLPYFRGRYRGRARWLALLVGLVFVAHPLQTMAVTYVSQRAESLAAMFYLLTLACFMRATTAATSLRRALGYAAAVAASQLAMLAKETAATLPLMVLWCDFCWFAGGRMRVMARRWLVHTLLFATLIAALALSWRHFVPVAPNPIRFDPSDVTTHLSGAAAGADVGDSGHGAERRSPPEAEPDPRSLPRWWEIPSAGFQLREGTPWQYLLTQFGVVTWYLRLYLLPTKLCFDYGWQLVDSPWRTDVILPFFILLGIGLTGAVSFSRQRLVAFSIGWFFLTLAPSSSVIPLADAAFEHRMYLPLIGLAWLTVAAVDSGLQGAMRRLAGCAKALRWIGSACAVAWIAALGILTVERNRLLRDPLALAADSVAKAPHHWRPHYDLGNALMRAGRWDDAAAELESAIASEPRQGPPRIHLAQIYLQRGMTSEAEAQLRAATGAQERSVVATAYRQLGYLYLQRRAWDDATAALRTAARLMPQWSHVHKHLARLHARKGDWAAAAAELEAGMRLNSKLAVELRGEAAGAHYRAGLGWAGNRDWRRAAGAFEAALRHNPRSAGATHWLAIAYAHLDDWTRAIATIEAAASLSPHDSLLNKNRRRIRAHQLPLAPSDG